jgi:hypothetical protein
MLISQDFQLVGRPQPRPPFGLNSGKNVSHSLHVAPKRMLHETPIGRGAAFA